MDIKDMTANQMVKRAIKLMYHSDNPWSHRDEIFELLYAAYHKGSGRAASLIAAAHEEEELTQRDDKVAEHWYHIAADMGDGYGLYERAIENFMDYPTELKYLKLSAEAGCPDGMCFYAEKIMYVHAYEAEEWLKKASRKGYAHANYLLGEIYRHGLPRYIDKNPSLARKYAFKNKKNGYTFSIIQIGNIYDFGIGGKKNHVKARKQYESLLFEPDANGFLARHYIYGLGGLKKDYKKAIELLTKSLDQTTPNPLFFYELGRCYRKGLGVEKDLKKAEEYQDKYLTAMQSL